MNAKNIFLKLKESKFEGYASADHALMAWGASKFITHDDSDANGLYNLKFKVHATNFKGWVRIAAVDTADNYRLTFEHHDNKSGEYSTYFKLDSIKPNDFISAIDSVLEPTIALSTSTVRPSLDRKFDAKPLAKEFMYQLKKDGNYLSEDLVADWFQKVYNLK